MRFHFSPIKLVEAKLKVSAVGKTVENWYSHREQLGTCLETYSYSGMQRALKGSGARSLSFFLSLLCLYVNVYIKSKLQKDTYTVTSFEYK